MGGWPLSEPCGLWLLYHLIQPERARLRWCEDG